MRVGSLFSGIGGFDLALEDAGMQVVWQVEIDPQCQMVLERHWPHVARFGDIRGLKGDELEPVDLVCGGFPCQDLSVAGRRAGLAGERSGLFFEFMRLVARLSPRWVLIENVPGLLSSNGGRDMGTVLWTLGKLGYGYAYRVLDAQYWGVAQRRRRVFIVGCLGDWTAAAKVLFEPESCEGNPTPSRAKGQEFAGTLGGGSGRRGWADNLDSSAAFASDLAYAVSAGSGGSKFGSGRDRQDTFVIQDVRGGTRDRTDHGQGIGIRADGLSYTLRATERHAVAYTLRADPGGTGQGHNTTYVAHTLRSQQRGTDDPDRKTFVIQNIVANTLTSTYGRKNWGSSGQTPDFGSAYVDSVGVRKLTPLECERLQGFPDDWTRYRPDGREISDSARYRMLGNAVCVPVAKWVGQRIVTVQIRASAGEV